MRKILLHNSIQTYKVTFFLLIFTIKSHKFFTRARILICERHFFFNERHRPHSAVSLGHETHTNDKRKKEKQCYIYLFTEIITIFATQVE